MCSKIVPPRFSFSHDVPELQKKKQVDVPRKDTMLLESNHDFEFSSSISLEFESSSADELFSNGVILPIQMQKRKNTTRRHTLFGEAPYMRLPPLPMTPSVDKMKRDVNASYCDHKKTYSTSFWGFSRSKSLSCDTKKSLMCYSPPLSRSNSTGSVAQPKRVSSIRQQHSAAAAAKALSSYSTSNNLYPIQRSHSGKTYGGSYANGLWISPVLNLPTPCISKGRSGSSLFGLGSFLRLGKAKKSKK